ncbi:UBX domain protein Ubx2 [Penicillium ochrochloron]
MESDLVAQFAEITGATPELAAQYLQLADFDIEQSMQLFFENGGAPLTEEPAQPPRRTRFENEAGVVHIDSDTDDDNPPARAQTSTRAAGGSTFEDDAAMARRLQEEMYGGGPGAGGIGGNDEDVRAPMARTTETLVGPDLGFDDEEDMHTNILSQLRARQRGGQGRAGIFNQRSAPSIWAGDSAETHQERLSMATGGASETSSKSNMLAEMYRPPFEIMSRVPWDVARDEGRENEKWLLVNVQDTSIFDCQVLNRDLWKDKTVQETIREHFVFLQFSKDDPKAAPYLQYYFQGSDVSDNYPHIAIVDPRTGEQMKVWSGPPVIKASDFLMQLHEFLDRYSLNHNVRNPVAKRKSEKKEKTVDAMTEEEMMEMAINNSLGGGLAAGPKLEDPDDLTRSTEDVKGKGRATGAHDHAMSDVIPEAAGEVEESPFSSIPSNRPHAEPEADPATTTRIQFRHPSGRVIRRFALSDPVQRIYEWLKADPPLEDKAGVEFELNAMGQNLIDSLSASIQDAGLKNGTVMIGYLED